MKNLFNEFEKMKGAKFIRINEYLSSTSGEVANHTISVGISIENAKKTDLMRLKNCTDEDLAMVSKASNIDFKTCKLALNELIDSAEKNLSKNIEDRTAQSQAQTESYIPLIKNGSMKLNRSSLLVHIFGMHINKDVIKKGEYKKVNSRPKTIAKKAIKKHLDLRADNFRTFIVPNVDNISLSGKTLEITINK